MDTVKIKKESKRKIRVDFERAPLLERLKSKYLSMYFLKRVVFLIFKLVLLIGVSYVILFPYITKIFGSFMTADDFKDVTVILLSKSPTLDQYKYIITENGYWSAFITTFLTSLSVALIQTIICALIGYGLAKFKFKGNSVVFFLVIFTMMVPQEAIRYSMLMHFKLFTTESPIGGFLEWIGVLEEGSGFERSLAPLYMLVMTGLGFKNGLYIFLFRQFFKGVPDELEESAYVDGSSTMRTFFTIIIPLAIPMMVTVFIFSFAWQWTDDFFTTEILFDDGYWNVREGHEPLRFMSSIVKVPETLGKQPGNLEAYRSAVMGTATILIALPLILAYLFVQKYIVQGIERSGIVG